jgi:hypothetical protein
LEIKSLEAMGERAGAQDLVQRTFYGPTGLINAVEHTLRAYTWNLIEGYCGNLVFRVTEIDEAEGLSFCGRRLLLQF